MTREEQIMRACERLTESLSQFERQCFIAGAEWADKHPKYIEAPNTQMRRALFQELFANVHIILLHDMFTVIHDIIEYRCKDPKFVNIKNEY